MIFPEFLKKGDAIGVTAPSDGNRKPMDFERLDLAKSNLTQKGFRVFETKNVRQSDGRGRSSTKEERAGQLAELWNRNDVKYIFSAKGGDFLMEILPLLDFAQIRQNPKWFQGFSDNTGLTYSITVNCDMATVYGNHWNDFAMEKGEKTHPAIQNNLSIMTGNPVIQTTFDFYEDGFYDRETPDEGYREDKKSVQYATLYEKIQPSVKLRGRLLGGCLDVLLNLVGTSFDRTKEFIRTYQSDGILWYLESFSLDSDSLTRGLWQLKNAGWFETATGFVFGRPCFFESFTNHSYREAVEVVLSELGVPIVYEADIGHKSPQFTIINGAMGTWTVEGGKSELQMELN